MIGINIKIQTKQEADDGVIMFPELESIFKSWYDESGVVDKEAFEKLKTKHN